MLTLSEMPQNYQFIQNLIDLRSHYQSVIDDAERDSNHTTEQLNHINALLVDQLAVNQQFTESLLQLKAHYQALRSQHSQKNQNAKEQIAHINALLADSLVLQHREQQPISIQVATREQQALSGAMPTADTRNALIANNGEELHRQSLESAQESNPPEILEQIILDDGQGVGDGAIANQSEELPQQELEVAESPELPQVSEPQIPTDSHQVDPQPELEPPTELPDVEDSFERSPRHTAPIKTPLLPQYRHLNKSEAVEQILQEEEGKVLHVNYIIRALHGELTPSDIAAEKPRMFDTLKKGVAKGLWDRVPDSPGCYTADVKLVDSEAEPKKIEGNKRKARKPNGKATEGMLPRYQNLTFTDAVESVMRDRSGEIVTSNIMTWALYGELEGTALVETRNKIGKIMWSGASQGRWQSVPGQKGACTLDLKLLERK
jgi:hypothetical protein